MGANGALKMWKVLGHTEQVLAIEAMCAAQASDFRSPEMAMAPALAELQTSFREVVPFLEKDAVMAPLMAAAKTWIVSNDPHQVSTPC